MLICELHSVSLAGSIYTLHCRTASRNFTESLQSLNELKKDGQEEGNSVEAVGGDVEDFDSKHGPRAASGIRGPHDRYRSSPRGLMIYLLFYIASILAYPPEGLHI
jgi:hypothetical protein